MSRSSQLDLYDQPRSRTTDPETSRLAVGGLAKSGKLTQQRAETLSDLATYVDEWGVSPTAWELAHGDITLRYMYSRRLGEIRDLGFAKECDARECRLKGTTQATWDVTEKGRGYLRGTQ